MMYESKGHVLAKPHPYILEIYQKPLKHILEASGIFFVGMTMCTCAVERYKSAL